MVSFIDISTRNVYLEKKPLRLMLVLLIIKKGYYDDIRVQGKLPIILFYQI